MKRIAILAFTAFCVESCTSGMIDTGASTPPSGGSSGRDAASASDDVSGAGGSGATGAMGGAGAAGAAGTTGTAGTRGTGGTSGTGGTPGTGGMSGTGGTSGSAGAGGSSGAAGWTALLAPAQGALFGTFVGAGTLAQQETLLGRKIAILQNYFAWTDSWVGRVPGDLAGGRIPLITWIPDNAQHNVSLDNIINGTYDTMITAQATAAKNVGQRFFLRWGHEMNGNWSIYGGAQNGANVAATTKFVSAWRHIHDIFVRVGASNVLWIFCPNVTSVPNDAYNQWPNYYPGDNYVDWMSFDGYNWGSFGVWESFLAMVTPIYAGLAAKNKPIMIAETSSSETGGDKVAWIAAVVPALKTSYPAIKAFVWFDVAGSATSPDWRFASSPASATASAAMARDPYFSP